MGPGHAALGRRLGGRHGAQGLAPRRPRAAHARGARARRRRGGRAVNVYAILEDGEPRIFGAPNMSAAVEAAWADALKDETERAGRPLTDEEATNERKIWERDVLESVTLVGEIVNFDDLLTLAPTHN